ncbi:uncharacterized protein C8Q71DRAFT_325547 [Rhodofomes roseus]|uniref:Uncharacterized protein n=1 Tax=Rhodofomes roseus TaxID=34475 RepID=A0ABQ8KTM1_9APHY|nr:uncharacterized protein C8Q71DRAFT_325547 [Rhodofomes roseus]KAH9841348.1 hypothetical protein C8Q71DRAFT_325547 [Rhodofomes roseus]
MEIHCVCFSVSLLLSGFLFNMLTYHHFQGRRPLTSRLLEVKSRRLYPIDGDFSCGPPVTPAAANQVTQDIQIRGRWIFVQDDPHPRPVAVGGA